MNDNNQLKPYDDFRNLMIKKDEETGKSKIAPAILKLLPKDIDPDAFINVCMYALSQDFKGKVFAPATLFMACCEVVKLGLVPDNKDCALVIFNDTITPLIMRRGLQKLAVKGGVVKWDTRLVHEHDHYRYLKGDVDSIEHEEKSVNGKRGKIVKVYSIATMRDGTKVRDDMDIEEVQKHRAMAKTPKFWNAHEGEMTKKCMMHRLFKSLPLTQDAELLKQAIDDDNRRNNNGFENAKDITPKPAQSQAERLGGKGATAEADVVNDDNNGGANDNNDNSGASGGAMSGFGEDGKGDNNGNS